MDINKSFYTGLAVGAFSIAVISLVLWPSSKVAPAPNSDELQMLVRYKLNKNTGMFDTSFEDGSGSPGKKLDEVPLDDAGNALGELAKGKETIAGTHALTFATKSSPGCINTCIGSKCSKICD